MSFLSTTENVGFSGIPQNISEASCATQYKVAVESVPVVCKSEVNMFIHDSSGDEQAYIPHLSDNFFHTKFKIDPNDLYTFHDSDVVAGEITVSHTEDNSVYPENVDAKYKFLPSPNKEIDLLHSITNGVIKEEKKTAVSNGHYSPLQTNIIVPNNIDSKKLNAKVQKIKSETDVNSEVQQNFTLIRRPSVHSPKSHNTVVSSQKVSISNPNVCNEKSSSETFLDVFKREQGLVENIVAAVKTELNTTPTKSTPVPKKQSSVKSSSQTKPKRGRGPTVHEALQRITSQNRVLVLPNKQWHAPGEELFNCGPLDDKKANAFRQLESSSSDDDMPEFESGVGAICVEESAAESRGARLELRRAAMRRHVARAAAALQLTKNHKEQRLLATRIKKQLSGANSSCRLPTQTVNHLIAIRGMTTLLTQQEKRQLRESGWSGGESGRSKESSTDICAEEKCERTPLPCGRYCLSHVTIAGDQRLYAACAAVFAGGERCKQPLLPLQDQTPLCPEHAWKRDNYELLSRECKPQKTVRARAWSAASRPRARPPRRPRPKRRRRIAPRPASATAASASVSTPAVAPATAASCAAPPTVLSPVESQPQQQSLAEINVCSNSSTYDSSEDTAVGGLSETEYIVNNSHELEVGQVHDILDPSVLSQMPDEAFTEFFNQAEGGSSFAESSELAAALEAVLDERVLDERGLDISDAFTHVQVAKTKIQIPASMEMSSSAPS